jgi:hypothetical protein
MMALGEWRARRPYRAIQLHDLKRKPLPPSGPGYDGLALHLDFLAKSGLIKQSAADPLYRTFELTAKGHTYVQPELAEFGKPSMFPEVVKSIEEKFKF